MRRRAEDHADIFGESAVIGGVGVYGVNSENQNTGTLGGSDYGVKSEGDLVVEGETAAFRGNIGPNCGATFPRPAYDSGWVEGTVDGSSWQTFNHGIGGNIENYVVEAWERDNLLRIYPTGYMNLTSDSIVVRIEGDVAYSGRVRIWVYN